MNGTCYSYTTNGFPGRCGCPYGHDLIDYTCAPNSSSSSLTTNGIWKCGTQRCWQQVGSWLAETSSTNLTFFAWKCLSPYIPLYQPLVSNLSASCYSSALPSLQYQFPSWFATPSVFLQPTLYNSSRTCTNQSNCDPSETCWYSPSLDAYRCFCKPYSLPSGKTACANTSILQVNSLLWNTTTVNVTFDVASLQWAWFTNLNITYVTYMNTSYSTSPRYQITTNLLDYQYPYVKPLVVNYTSTWACELSRCNGHGVCLVNGTCQCDNRHFGSDCSLLDTTCASQNCNSNGRCTTLQSIGTACICFENWYGINCNQTLVECSERRCSIGHQCTNSLQGCF